MTDAAGAERLAVDVAHELLRERAGEGRVGRGAGLVRVRPARVVRHDVERCLRLLQPRAQRCSGRQVGRRSQVEARHEQRRRDDGQVLLAGELLLELRADVCGRRELEEQVVLARVRVELLPLLRVVIDRGPHGEVLPADERARELRFRHALPAPGGTVFRVQVERGEVRERRLLAPDRRVSEVVGNEDRVHLPPAFAGLVDDDINPRRPVREFGVERTPAEREAPVELILVVLRHDRLHAQLAARRGLAGLRDLHRERLGLLAMIDVPHPHAVLPGARHDQVAPATRFRFGRGRAHRVPLALAALRPLRGDARPGDAPCAGGLGLTGPVAERPFHAVEPLRFEPQVHRRLVRRARGDGGEQEHNNGEDASHGGEP